jgi:hypothetical protein
MWRVYKNRLAYAQASCRIGKSLIGAWLPARYACRSITATFMRVLSLKPIDS